jgi:hypothetical protein
MRLDWFFLVSLASAEGFASPAHSPDKKYSDETGGRCSAQTPPNTGFVDASQFC